MWSKTDDKMHDHPKVQDLFEHGEADALALWHQAHSWCGDQLSDGVVSAFVCSRWFPDWETKAAALVRVGLWEIAETSTPERPTFVFHDWGDYNDLRAVVLFNREQNALRAAFSRDKALKAAIDERDKDRCRYCGSLVHWADKRSPAGGTYDHIKPLADGGKNTLDNVVVSCRGCNQRKGKRTLRDALMRLLEPGSLGAPTDLVFAPPAAAHEVGTPGRVGSGRVGDQVRAPHVPQVTPEADR